MEADPAEQRAVERVAELHAAGWSLRKIAAALEAEGLRPRAGRRWHPQTVARIAAAGVTQKLVVV